MVQSLNGDGVVFESRCQKFQSEQDKWQMACLRGDYSEAKQVTVTLMCLNFGWIWLNEEGVFRCLMMTVLTYSLRQLGQSILKLLEAAAGSCTSVGGKTVIIDPGGRYGEHLNT